MDTDPWDWTVDEVVENLFGARGLLDEFHLTDLAATSITNLIRESETDGCELLLSTYDHTNQGIGLHQLRLLSQWRKLEMVIERLRFRSSKYLQYLRDKKEHAVYFEPYTAIRERLGHQIAAQRTITTSGASNVVKAEQLNPHDESIRHSEGREPSLLEGLAHSSTVSSANAAQPLALLGTGHATIFHRSVSASPEYDVQGLKRRSNDSGLGPTENGSSVDALSDVPGTEVLQGDKSETGLRLRRNETCVTDERGRKRRKLQLCAPDLTKDGAFVDELRKSGGSAIREQVDQDAVADTLHVENDDPLPLPSDYEGAIGNSATNLSPSEVVQESIEPIAVAETQHDVSDLQPRHIETTSAANARLDVVSSPSDPEYDGPIVFHTAPEKMINGGSPGSNFLKAIHEEMSDQEASEIVGQNAIQGEALEAIPLEFAVEASRREITANVEAENKNLEGDSAIELQKVKRRLQPELIIQITAEPQRQAEHGQCLNSEPAEADLPTNLSDIQHPAAIPNAQVESKKISRFRHEYLGRAALSVDRVFYGNTKVGQEITYDFSEHAPQLALFGEDTDDFYLTSDKSLPAGQRLFVAQCMRGFLCGDNIRSLVYGRKHLTAVIPYKARVCKRLQQPSLTLFTRSENSIIARRVDRAQWLQYDLANRALMSPTNENSQTLKLDVAKEAPLISFVRRDEVHDYDFLEKWQHQANDYILPTYGDSGSEGEYDLDVWNEMEKEKGTLERILARPSKMRVLGPKRMNEILTETENAFKERWRLRKLPNLELTAWSLWKSSRRQNNHHGLVESNTAESERLALQMLKIKRGILKESWSSEGRLKAQCKSFEESVFAREKCHWKISVLESSSAPQKPPAPGKLPRIPLRRQALEPLQNGEEDIESSSLESSNDDLDDFIDDDESEKPNDDAKTIDPNVDSHEDADSEHLSDAAGLDAESQVNVEDGLNSLEEESIMSRSIILRKKTKSSKEEEHDTEEPEDVLDSPLSKPKAISTAKAGKLSKSETRPEPVPLLLASLPAQTSTEPDIVDLTAISDSDEQTTRFNPRGKRSVTPPVFIKAEVDDPFSRPTKPKSAFRVPPPSSSSYDCDDTESTTIEKQSSGVGSAKRPPLNEPKQIAKLDPKHLVQIRDGDRLLIWAVHRTSSASRDGVIHLIKTQSSEILQIHLWEGMGAIEKDMDASAELTWDKLSPDERQACMRLAAWFVCWSQCSIAFPEGSSQDSPALIKKDVVKAQEEDAKFEAFYKILKQALQYYANKKKSQSTLLGSSPLTSKQKRKRRIESDSDISEENQLSKRTKKRVYEVQESQNAQELQRTGKLRIEQEKIRKAAMVERMKHLGGKNNDTSAKVINISAGQEQGIIVISPHITSKIKTHQLEGVRFLWREVVAANQGCLLAHTMGLGKTMQVITLLVTIAEASNSGNESIWTQIPENLRSSQTLILAPPTLIDNWYDEFLMWAPEPRSDNVGDIWKVASDVKLEERLLEIELWNEKGGVLLLGYESFRDLVNNPKRGKSESEEQTRIEEERHKKILDILLERPNIVIVDEAHKLKNPGSKISKAAAQFKTENRIALTGSPLSNNLEEYYSLISWTAPGYLGEPPEFRAKYVEPITAGLYKESTNYEKRNCLKKLRLLSIQLEPKMQRQDITVLKNQLEKKEFVIYVPLTALQEKAYVLYAKSMLSATSGKDYHSSKIWAALSLLHLLCNHPKCFRDKLLALKKDLDDSGKKEIKGSKKGKGAQGQERAGNGIVEEADEAILEDAMDLVPPQKMGMIEDMMNEQLEILAAVKESIDRVDLSHKMTVLMRIIAFSEEAGQKVLVFSHSLATLDFIGKALTNRGHKYNRLDGSTPMHTRNQLTKSFNVGKVSNVCIISTRAGGQGLNLFGANRVVIMDDSFNPMHEEQAIGRAYRIGQEKPVYVYRLTVGGTFEETIQNQSLFKVQLATHVVDKKHNDRYALGNLREYLQMPRELIQEDLSGSRGKDDLVLDRVLEDDQTNSIIRSIVPSETFKDLAPLTEEEERDIKHQVWLDDLKKKDPEAYRIEHEKYMSAVQQKAFSDIRAQDLAEFPHESATSKHPLTAQIPGTNHTSPQLSSYTPVAFPRPSTDQPTAQLKGMHVMQTKGPRHEPASSLNKPGPRALDNNTRNEIVQGSYLDYRNQRQAVSSKTQDASTKAGRPITGLSSLPPPKIPNPQSSVSNTLISSDTSKHPLSGPKKDMRALRDPRMGSSMHSPSASVSSRTSASSRRSRESSLISGKGLLGEISDKLRTRYRERIYIKLMSGLPVLAAKKVFQADNAKELCENLAVRIEKAAKQKVLHEGKSYREQIHTYEEIIRKEEVLVSFLRAEQKQAKPPTLSPPRTPSNTPRGSESQRLEPVLSKFRNKPVESRQTAEGGLAEGGLDPSVPSIPFPRPRRVSSTPLSKLQPDTPSLPETINEAGSVAGPADQASKEEEASRDSVMGEMEDTADGASDGKEPSSNSTAGKEDVTPAIPSAKKPGQCSQQ